jgi:tRNA(fMet)-specific endonuclease VapC
MSAVMLDTSAYSAHRAGHPAVCECIKRASAVVLCPVVIGELLAGFARGSRARRNREQLAEFLASAGVKTVDIGKPTAQHYASIRARLLDDGRPIPDNDMWIAASAMEHGLPLLTLDRHFAAVAGLLVVSSPADLLP